MAFDAGTSRTLGLARPELILSEQSVRLRALAVLSLRGFLFLVASSSALAVLFIFYFIARDAIPFFRLQGFREFFTSIGWRPASNPPAFGALAIFYGSGLVTLGAILLAVPLGVCAAVCVSDVLPFSVRQVVKPVIEMLAAIPSVAFGFFALAVFAPALQTNGANLLAFAFWLIAAPVAALLAIVASDMLSAGLRAEGLRSLARGVFLFAIGAAEFYALWRLGARIKGLEISSGTNALNVSIILGVMAIPTVISVSEDALQAVGRELREGSYALGATRAETLAKVVVPAASSGILAAIMLGIMRAVGETMVVWMASGNAAQIPTPWYNFLEPVRTLTATIAGDMGEADHVLGSARYHVLFAMALCLLTISFLCNLTSEWVVRRSRRKMGLE